MAVAGWIAAGGIAVRLPRALSTALDGHHPDLVVHVHVLVGDGAVRPRIARTWRFHGHWCLRHCTAVEQPWNDALAWHSRCYDRRHAHRRADRVAVLPLPHRGALLRPGYAGPERHRASGHHGDP